jgi:hypothetical protein
MGKRLRVGGWCPGSLNYSTPKSTFQNVLEGIVIFVGPVGPAAIVPSAARGSTQSSREAHKRYFAWGCFSKNWSCSAPSPLQADPDWMGRRVHRRERWRPRGAPTKAATKERLADPLLGNTLATEERHLTSTHKRRPNLAKRSQISQTSQSSTISARKCLSDSPPTTVA